MITKCQYPNCNHQAHFLMGWTNENGKLHWGLVCATHDKMLGRANLCKYMPLSEAILFERYLRETVNSESYLDFPEWLAQIGKAYTPLIPTILKKVDTQTTLTITKKVELKELNLPNRVLGALYRHQISVEELASMSTEELRKIRWIGKKGVTEIQKALEEYK